MTRFRRRARLKIGVDCRAARRYGAPMTPANPLPAPGQCRASDDRDGADVLYITLDGITDPLGRSQVLPYLIGLSGRGHRITLLSCEKPDRMSRDGEAIRSICAGVGIAWCPIRYHRNPPVLSGAWDAAMLKREAVRLHKQSSFDLVHCRSYIPAAAGLALKRRYGVKFLFDMRGFWPDERVEGGSWPLSNPLFNVIYRHFKRLETKLFAGADHVISLTHEGRRVLRTRPELQGERTGITVIPCCVDFEHFPLVTAAARQAARAALGIPETAKVAAYLGSVGTWYMLYEMLDFFRAYREVHRTAMLLLVTPDPSAALVRAAAARRVPEESLVIRSASRDEVPRFMAAADLGLFFIEPVFSKKASSPTKMGEMIALGLPIVTNAGVGDVAEIVAATGCGVAIDHFDGEAYRDAIHRVQNLPADAAVRRERARLWFDVEMGVDRYDACYRNLSGLAAMSPARTVRS